MDEDARSAYSGKKLQTKTGYGVIESTLHTPME